MKVLLMITQMEGGGAQKAAIQLSEGLGNRGHHAETCFFYIKRPTYIKHKNIYVIVQEKPRTLLDYSKLFFRLIKKMRQANPDAVISFTHYANIIGQSTALLCRVKKRIASQRNPSDSYPKIASFADRFLGIFGFYTSNTMVSETVKNSFSHYPDNYLQHAKVIPNGISFTPSKLSQQQARIRFALPLKLTIVGTTGRLAKQKNQSILIRAIGQIPDVHLALAGDGELKEELKQLAETHNLSGRVHFLGEIDPGDIPHFLRSADIFALPSLFEGMSNSLLEALAAGLPVIASDIPAQSEVIKPKDLEPCGILIPPHDAHAWQASIEMLCNDDRQRKKYVHMAMKRSEEFTVEKMVDSFEKLLIGK
jgi:glycosyltransferase involved in cell wall biosynthesis